MLYLCKNIFSILTSYRCYKIMGWVSIVLAAILCFLRIATPLLEPRLPQLSTWVEKQLPYPAHIQKLKLRWEGFSPTVSLTGVEIFDDQKNTLLNIGKMKLRLNVLQLFLARVQLNELVIENTALEIEYQNGRLSVLNFPALQFNLQDLSTQAPRNLFTRLIIKDSDVHLKINDNKKISLLQTALTIEAGNLLKVRGAANIADNGRIQIGANIPLLGSQEAKMYLHLQDEDVGQYKHFFSTLPIHIEKGKIDLEAWLSVANQHSMELTTRFELNNLALKDKRGKKRAFNVIKGGLNTQIQDKHWKIIGKDWQFSSKEDAKKMNFIVDSTLSADGRLWELTAQDVDVGLLLSEELDFPSSAFIHKIKVHRPGGYLDYLHMALLAKEQKLTPKFIDVVFTSLHAQAGNNLPGFSGLSGAMTFAGKEAKMILQSEHLELNYPNVYPYPIEMTNLATVLNGQFFEDSVTITAETLQANLFDTALSGQGTWHFKEKSKPDVEMIFHLDTMKMATALTLLPRQVMNKNLVSWLDNALLGGDVLSSTCVLRGNLADFPFDNAEGIFEIYTELENAHLDYAKGWPALTDLTANLLFHNRELSIVATSGTIKGLPDNPVAGQLLNAKAHILDLGQNIPQLTIDAKIASTLAQGVSVIQQSPLQASLGKTLSPLDLQGNMTLSLGLEVPLSLKEEHKIKVRGSIEVEQAKVNITEWDFAVTDLRGNVSFTENKVKSDRLSGKLLQTPTLFSIESNTRDNTQVRVTAQGKVNLKQLQKEFHLKNIPQIKGETDYTAELMVSPSHLNHTRLLLTSNLQGVTLDAPHPFSKQAEDTHPFECEVNFDTNEFMHFFVRYGNNINAAYSLAWREKAWQPIGGHIHFGAQPLAKYREDQVFLIDGEVKTVDVEQWKTFLSVGGLLPEARPGTLALEPLIELNIEDFILYGLSFPKEKIEARWEGKARQWNFNFAGTALSGYAILPAEENQPIVINLQKLALTKEVDLPEFTAQEANKNPLDIKIKELTLKNKVFTDIQARLEPSWKGYFSPDVKAKMKGTDVNFTGSWDYLSPHKKVAIEGKIQTKNISHTLSALGLKGSLRKAKGTIGFSVQWNGGPAKIDLASLSGQADLSLSRGMINGVNPGIGRVLSLLNLDNVHRRLNLDFSDVTKDGLVFDELKGKFKFGKGKISSNKITLKSPTVKIEAFGQADLQNQALDGEMIVMPDLTGSLPMAAAIASANPAIGAAVWVVDKMVGHKIQQIHRLRYKVLGTWQSPQVEEVHIMTAKRG